MSDRSYREFLETNSPLLHTSSPSSEEFSHSPCSPIPTAGDNHGQSKLYKLLKVTNAEVSPKILPRNLGINMNQKDESKKRGSFHLNSNKELLESRDLVIDPLSERGVLPLLRSMKQKICKLGFFKGKSPNETNLALVKSQLKMRRKSDVSKWSGGVSHLEQITPFLVYDYVPAITLQDLSYKKDILPTSPLLMRRSVDTRQMSVRYSPSLSGSPGLSPDKREIESMVRSSVVTLVMPDMNMKQGNIKDFEVINLEEKVTKGKDQVQLERFREFLVSVGIVSKGTTKLPLGVINEDNLRESTARNGSANSPYMSQFDLNEDLKGRPFEPMNLKSKTFNERERKQSLNDRMKQKVHTVVEQTKEKKSFIAQPSIFIPPAPTSSKPSPTPSLNVTIKSKHTRVHSQDSLAILKHLENEKLEKFDDKKEDKKPFSKNIKMQAVAKKKLAEILSPEKPVKIKSEGIKADKSLPINQNINHKPKISAISFREPLNRDPDLNVRPLFLKDDKHTIQSHRVSPFWGINNTAIQQVYMNNNSRQIPVVAKPKKYKSPLAEELMPLSKRKFVLPKVYMASKSAAKIGAIGQKKITLP